MDRRGDWRHYSGLDRYFGSRCGDLVALGIQEDDVSTSLNGMPIDNPNASKQLVEAFSGEENLVFEITSKDGTTNSVSVTPEDLMGSLKQ